MISDRAICIDILTRSFNANRSVNYVVKQDARRTERIGKLMAYCYDTCSKYGEVIVNTEKTACALVYLPHEKKTSITSILADIKLITGSFGLGNISKVLAREKAINATHPKEPFYYLWYIGVDPTRQGGGEGTRLLQELLLSAERKGLDVYLETSEPRNMPWYEKNGFERFQNLDLGYTLACYRKINASNP